MVDNPLNVAASLYAARHGYELVDEIEFEKRVLACAEGHVIKKGYVFAGEGGKKIILGGTCQWKVFLFKQWENITYEQITDALEDIGKMFWTAQRDGLWGDIHAIVKADNIDMDFTRVPPPEKQEWFKATLGSIIKRIVARNKAEAKRKALEAEKEKKMACTQIVDKDYLMLKSAALTGDARLDSDRTDLLRKFERFRNWSEQQRKYAMVMIRKSGMVNVSSARDNVSKEYSTLINLVRGINKESFGFVKEFTDTMLSKKLLNLSVKQRKIVIDIITEYIAKRGISLGFDHAKVIVSLNP